MDPYLTLVKRLSLMEAEASLAISEALDKPEDLYKQYVETEKVDEQDFEYFRDQDPTADKYLSWMLKQVARYGEQYSNLEIANVVKEFEQQKKRKKLSQPDINQHDMESARHDIENAKKMETQQDKKKIQGEGIEILEDDENKRVALITSYEACHKYGKGSKWCVSADPPQGKKDWDQYYRQRERIYIVWDKNKPHDPKYHKWLIEVPLHGEPTAWDAQDNDYTFEKYLEITGFGEEDD